MTLKEASAELLKVAEQIEKEADEVTEFVCADCNHTSTLAKINAKRKDMAESEKNDNEDIVVANVTVNDKIYCPACNGVMSYRPTEASTVYYTKEAEEQEKVEEDTEEPIETKKKASIDYDSLQRYTK